MRLVLLLLFAILIAPPSAMPPAWADTPAAVVDDEGNLLIAGIVMAGTPLYILLQILTARSWTGRWRIAALVPVAPMGFAIGHALFALAGGSRLWPILLIVGAPLALLYLLALIGLRRVTRTATAARSG